MAFNLFGDGLRDAFDPRDRRDLRRRTVWPACAEADETKGMSDPRRAGSREQRWRWSRSRSSGSVPVAPAGSGGSNGSGGGPPKTTTPPWAPCPRLRREGRDPPKCGLAGRGATASTRVTPTTATPGTCCATTRAPWSSSRPSREGRPHGRPRPRDRPRQVQRRRQDVDLHDPEGPEVRGRHADHRPRTSSTPCCAHRRRAVPAVPLPRQQLNLPKGYDGPLTQPEEHRHLLGHHTPDDSTIVFHLKQPFAELRLPRAASGHRPIPPPRTPARRTTPAPDRLGPYMCDGTTTTPPGSRPGAQPQLGPRHGPESYGPAGRR